MSRKAKILVTRKLPEALEQLIGDTFVARLNPDDRLLTAAEIIAAAQGCDGILLCISEQFDAALIAALPSSVKALSTYSVGYNHIDIQAAKRRGIAVGFTPDAVTDATADVTFLAMLGAARRAFEWQELMRRGGWQGWSPTQLLGHDISGKRLGILGMGRIGRAVAQRARGFGMEVHYHSRRRLPGAEEQGAIWHESFEDLLPVSDILSIHCPATAETRGIVNAASFALLPPGAILVNTARGDMVVDEDLIAALRDGRVFAAGLDVYAGEPNFDRRYLDLPNVFALPHIGTSTIETRLAMGRAAVANLGQYFHGNTMPYPVT